MPTLREMDVLGKWISAIFMIAVDFRSVLVAYNQFQVAAESVDVILTKLLHDLDRTLLY